MGYVSSKVPSRISAAKEYALIMMHKHSHHSHNIHSEWGTYNHIQYKVLVSFGVDVLLGCLKNRLS